MPVAGRRVFFGIVGIVATTIAIVGVWLPGIPTVFPLIIALWAFSKSSARLERWVKRLPLFKHAMVEAQRFERERSVDRRVKLIAAGSAWASTIIVLLTTRNIAVASIVASIAIACSIFMLIIPTRVQEPVE